MNRCAHTAAADIGLLARLAERLPEPRDLFAGITSRLGGAVHDVLAFHRRRAIREAPTVHRRHVLIVCLDGGGAAIVDGHYLNLLPGHCVLIFPHQVHHYARFAGEKISWLYVTFEGTTPGALELLRNTVVRLPAGAEAHLGAVMEDYREWRRTGGRRGLDAPHHVALLLEHLLAVTPARGPRGPSTGAGSLVSRVCAEVYGRMAEGIRLKDMAAHLGLSESHLRAAFRARTGLSLGGFLRQARVQRAGQLLLTTDHTVTEIAAMTGFESLFTFSRCFRTMAGQSPRAYRRRGGRAAR